MPSRVSAKSYLAGSPGTSRPKPSVISSAARTSARFLRVNPSALPILCMCTSTGTTSLEVPTFNGIQLGAYGGAVDKHGNLWFVPMGGVALPPRRLGFVDGDNLSYQVWDMPGEVASYGVTVAADGRVWISSTIGASAAVFDPDTEQFTLIQEGFLSLGGLAQDADGHVWISTSSGAVAVDEGSLTVTQTIDTPGGAGVKGVAIDRDDYVWLVTDIEAYRFDTDDLSYLVYDGLTGPYTYSDMTGSALANAECGPEG